MLVIVVALLAVLASQVRGSIGPTCPKRLAATITSQNPGAARELVPTGAREVLVCGYYGGYSRSEQPGPEVIGSLAHAAVVDAGGAVRHYTRELNSLPTLGGGGLSGHRSRATAARARTDVTIARLREPTPLAGGAKLLVWSTFSHRKYWLTGRQDGRNRRLSDRPLPVSFDASVGQTADGRAVVAYSRCKSHQPFNGGDQPTGLRSPATAAKECRLFSLDPQIGRERRLKIATPAGASDVLPAIWSNRLVFFRKRGDTVKLLTMLLGRPRTLRSLPIGTLPPDSCGSGHPCYDVSNGPVGIGFRDGIVAFGWQVEGAGCEPSFAAAQYVSELWVVRIRGGRATKLSSGCEPNFYSSPFLSQSANQVYALFTNPSSASTVLRYSATGTLQSRRSLPNRVVAVAGDGRHLFALRHVGARWLIETR